MVRLFPFIISSIFILSFLTVIFNYLFGSNFSYGFDFGFGKVGILFFVAVIIGIIYLVWGIKKGLFKESRKFSWFSPTVGSLIFSNIVAIDFVLAYNWQIYEVLFLYWFQSLIIGGFYLLKILSLKKFSVEGFTINNHPVKNNESTKISVAIHFFMLFGGFHLVYLAFLTYFSPQIISSPNLFSFFIIVLVFFFNHLFSFLYFYASERNGKNIGSMVFIPVLRIIPMHIFICCGVFLFFGIFGIIFFLLLKTGVDVMMHAAEHDPKKAPKNVNIGGLIITLKKS